MNKQVRYLWELKIIDLPLGWEEYYQLALKEFPDGENIDLSDGTFFCRPVEYRTKLIENFEKYSNEAQEVFNDNNLNFQDKCNKLLKLDVILNNILSDWINDTYDSSIFNPNDINYELISNDDLEFYFNNNNFSDLQKYIVDLKFFKN